MEPLSLNCSAFNYRNLSGTSLESIIFYSDLCINSQLQYYTLLIYIVLLFLAAFVIFLIFLRSILFSNDHQINKINFVFQRQQKIYFLVFVNSLGLAYRPLSNFLNFDKPYLMIYGLSLSAYYLLGTYILRDWNIVFVKGSSLKEEDKLIKLINLAFVIANSLFNILFWAFWITAGVNVHDWNTYNWFITVGLLWLGVCATVGGALVFWLGLALLKLISVTLVDTSAFEAARRKILWYTFIQVSVCAVGGVGTIGESIWYIHYNQLGVPIRYYFYMSYYWTFPTLVLGNLLIVAYAYTFSSSNQTSQINNQNSHRSKRSESKVELGNQSLGEVNKMEIEEK